MGRDRLAEARAARDRASSELAAMRGEEAEDSSPAGWARHAKQRGDRYFEVSLPFSSITGTAFFGSADTQTAETDNGPDPLGTIEREGWRLEHVGYVFVQTESESSKRPLLTGARVATSGVITGVYLFRNSDLQ